MANVVTTKLPPVPTAIGILQSDSSSVVSQQWNQWFIQLKTKVDTINANIAGIGDLTLPTNPSFVTLNSSGTWGTNTIATGVTAGTYGDSTHVPQITIGSDGRISSAAPVLISGGGGGGKILQVVTTTFHTTASDNTVIPYSSSPFTNTQGAALSGFDTSITPGSITSIIRCTLHLGFLSIVAGGAARIGLFKDTDTNAFYATNNYQASAMTGPVTFISYLSPATTSAITIKVRWGTNSSSFTNYINWDGTTAPYGTPYSYLTLEEILV